MNFCTYSWEKSLSIDNDTNIKDFILTTYKKKS